MVGVGTGMTAGEGARGAQRRSVHRESSVLGLFRAVGLADPTIYKTDQDNLDNLEIVYVF